MTGRVVFVGVHVVVGAGVVIAGTDVVVGGSSSARLDVRARQGDKSGEDFPDSQTGRGGGHCL